MLHSPVVLSQGPRILVILLGALGDIARGIRILAPIKNRYPEAHITWLVEKKWSDFLTLHDDIDALITFEKKKWRSSFLNFSSQIKHMRQRNEGFDLTLDLSRHAKSGLLSFLSRSRLRIGFHPKNAKEGNHLFQNAYIPEVDNSVSKVFHYAEFATAIGVVSAVQDIRSSGLAQSKLQSLMRERFSNIADASSIAVVLGSSWPSKDWHTEGYVRLLRALLKETEYEVLLLGDPGKAEFARWLRDQAPSTENLRNRVHALAGETTLQELTALLDHSQVAIGPDSGPGHISSAVSTPYVTLFGPTDPERVAPFGCTDMVIRQNIDCMPCHKRVCPGRQQVCMQLLSVDDILQKVYLIGRGGMSFDYQ